MGDTIKPLAGDDAIDKADAEGRIHMARAILSVVLPLIGIPPGRTHIYIASITREAREVAAKANSERG